MNIYPVNSINNNIVDAFQILIPQLDATANLPTRADLEQIINSENSRLFVVEEDNTIIGSATLVTYKIPVGRKAWIEDVVVDVSARGKGVAAKLIEYILKYAREKGLNKVDLTSSLQRKTAYVLYERLGFEQRESRIFRKELNE